jgi:hypothetical protein
MNFSDFIINGPQFESIADFVINPHDGKNLTNYDLQRLLNSNAIIFTKTDFIFDIFNLLRNSPNNYILITHLSDYSIDENRFNHKPRCIKKWYAINVDYQHEDLIPIPLGLYPHIFGPRYSLNTWDESEPYNQALWFSDIRNEYLKNEKKDILYCCWNDRKMAPDFKENRDSIVEKLINNKLRIIHGTNTRHKQNVYFESLCKYTVSPPGNGIDSHRTWESLYLGCIPIVKKHIIYDSFNLPLIQVDNWSEINTELLNNFDESKFSLEKLDMNYWKKIILEDFEKIKKVEI